MKHQETTFRGYQGLQLFAQFWRPDDPKAVFILVHGKNEHSSRYSRLVEPLASDGYAIYAFDLRGHGRSLGRRGHILSWAEFRGDLQAFIAWVKSLEPGLPVFLYGHSMGSLIVLDYVMHHPDSLRGLIVSGAAIQPAGVASKAKILTAKLMSRVLPQFTVPLDFPATTLTHDKEAAAELLKDPLMHAVASARWGVEALRTVDEIKASPHKVRLPVLFVHGAEDPLNVCRAAQDYVSQIPGPDKQFISYPGALHEVHNDATAVQLSADIQSWLEAHLN